MPSPISPPALVLLPSSSDLVQGITLSASSPRRLTDPARSRFSDPTEPMEPPPAQVAASERDRSPPPPPPLPTSSAASPLAVVCSFWKDFDLEKERSGLDEQGLKITENQETSQKNRLRLAESTRDFKKASSDEKLSLFNSLLKSYQEEVDNLTNTIVNL